VRIQRRPAWKCDSAIMRQLKSQMDESSESPTNIHCDPFGEPNLVPHRDYATFLASPTGSDSLKAVVITRYGPPVDVLQLREVATPEPAEDEILIRLHASSFNPLDGFTIRGPLFFSPKLGRLLKPKHKIPGADFAGRVESVGGAIKRFRTGDEVFGASFTGKGLGGFAEFACAVKIAWRRSRPTCRSRRQRLCRWPRSLPSGSSRSGSDPARPEGSDRWRVWRCGTFAVQIAKSFGAEVTAVCSPRNVDAARVIGADHVIDYKSEDFTRSGLRYDLILGENALPEEPNFPS
jgi:threonine dehydrogenase-like Zn-dependent dehydrogenase